MPPNQAIGSNGSGVDGGAADTRRSIADDSRRGGRYGGRPRPRRTGPRTATFADSAAGCGRRGASGPAPAAVQRRRVGPGLRRRRPPTPAVPALRGRHQRRQSGLPSVAGATRRGPRGPAGPRRRQDARRRASGGRLFLGVVVDLRRARRRPRPAVTPGERGVGICAGSAVDAARRGRRVRRRRGRTPDGGAIAGIGSVVRASPRRRLGFGAAPRRAATTGSASNPGRGDARRRAAWLEVGGADEPAVGAAAAAWSLRARCRCHELGRRLELAIALELRRLFLDLAAERLLHPAREVLARVELAGGVDEGLQLVVEIDRVLVAILGILRERLEHDALELVGDLRLYVDGGRISTLRTFSSVEKSLSPTNRRSPVSSS